MTTSAMVLLILLLYIGIMLVISTLARRRNQTFQDTIAAPGQTTLLLLVGSAVGGQIGSGFVMGGTEYGATYGIGGAWYGIGCGLSYLVVAVLTGFIFKHKYLSPADYFSQRYDGKATQLIYSFATICSCTAVLAGQLLAGRSIFLLLGIPATWGVVLTAVIALVYSNISGLWGSMAVSSVQTVIIFLGIITALAALLFEPGADALTRTLPTSYFDAIPFDGEFFVSIVFPIILASPVYQMTFQSTSSAKTARTAFWGYTLAGIIIIPIALIPPVLGMFGHAMLPNTASSQVFMELLLTRLPTVVAAVILAAIICAIIASCNSAYIAMAANFVHDIYQGMISPDADSKTCKRMMLVVDVTACVLAIFLALKMNDIIQVLSMGYGLLASGCLVPFLGGILWKGGTTKGALISSAVGITASVTSSLGLIHLPYACIISVLLAAVAFVVGSLLPRKRTTDKISS